MSDPRLNGRVAVKIAVSATAIALFLIRQRWPNAVRLDSTSFALLAIAAAPWFLHLIDTLELPGGTKIKLRELEEAVSTLPLAAEQPEPESVTKPPLEAVTMHPQWLPSLADPNLSLVGLRIEIEKRLRALAQILELSADTQRSLPRIVRELERVAILNADEAVGLRKMIDAGNRAAHGAEVEIQANAFLVGGAPRLLAWLDTLIDDAM